MSINIAVLLTCHNRRQKTVECLERLFNQPLPLETCLLVYLLDDGSTDGTATFVATTFPQVNILTGDGSLFWNRGMHRAFGEALKHGHDYYLWLNDDTRLTDLAVKTLLNDYQALMEKGRPNSIIISSTRDPLTGKFSYGGYRQKSIFNPLKLELIMPAEELTICDTFCGNCVLIPGCVAEKVGNIDPVYSHRWGDVDYGLRAKAQGCETWVAAGYLAECEANPLADRWQDSRLSLREKIRELHSIKGIGRKDWWTFVRRFGGPFWFLAWMKPYLRITADSLLCWPKFFIQIRESK